MAEQTEEKQEKQLSFLEKVLEQSELQNSNDAQTATKIVFRTLRDLMPNEEVNRIEQELQNEAPQADMKIADLWNDPNVMVAFFSRVSPFGKLSFGYDTFMSRVNQEAALPKSVSAESVTKAVFAATKDELPEDRIKAVADILPDDISQLWRQA